MPLTLTAAGRSLSWAASRHLVGRRWWWRFVWLVPPPLGAFAGWSGAWRDRRWWAGGWPGQGSVGELVSSRVGDDQPVGGPGDGDTALVVQAVVIWADQHEVVQFSNSAIFPMDDVVRVQPAGGAAAGHDAAPITVFQSPAQAPADGAGRAAGADRLPVALKPHLARGVAQQVRTFIVG